MSSWSWLSDEEFLSVLVSSGASEALNAEAARRLERVVEELAALKEEKNVCSECGEDL